MEKKEWEAFSLNDEEMEDVIGGLKFAPVSEQRENYLEGVLNWYQKHPKQMEKNKDALENIRKELNRRKNGKIYNV